MSYLVLARKWRPRSFDTLVGQDHVVRALRTALDTGRLHHAWLFTGTRGVGKTSLSRILAKALNCQQGVTSSPCGHCDACRGIDADRYVDYLELDAASNRGVEDMSRLLDQAVYTPTAGRYKVYMIDEVHMLTGHAFNAMLKTLEEPPPHVKFILATTDPQKIPVTVLSRCLQFNLKQMPPQAVAGHLAEVLQAEDISAEPAALRLLGQAARGSMRDALSLTDQAIAYAGGSVSEASVRDMLGVIDQQYLVRLLQALVAGDGHAVLAVADELATRGLSYAGALDDLAQLLAQVAMAQRIPGLAADDHPQAEAIRELARAMSADAVQLFYSVCLHSRAELALAPDEHAGFVMACLRMLAFVTEGGGVGSPPPAPVASGPSAGNRPDAASLAGPASTGQPSAALPASVNAPAPPLAESDAAAPPAGPAAARAALAAARAAAQTNAGARPTKDAAAPAATDDPSASSAPSATLVTRSSPADPAIPAAPADSAVAPAATASTAAAPAPDEASAGPLAHDAPAPMPAVAPSPDTPAAATTAPPNSGNVVNEPSPAPMAERLARAEAEPEQGRTASPVAAPAADEPPWEDIPPPWEDAAPAQGSSPRSEAAGRVAAREPEAREAEDGSAVPSAPRPATPAASTDSPATAAAPSLPSARPAPTASPSASADIAWPTAAQWPELASRLPLRGLAGELARQSEWLAVEQGTVVLRVPTQALIQAPTVERLRQALAEHFGQSLTVRFEVGATGSDTAHAVAQSEREARQREAESVIARDPFVHELVSEFDGRIVPGSVRPFP